MEENFLIKYKYKDSYECVLQVLKQEEKNLTFEEIVKFCTFVIKAPIKELYSEARKLLVAFNSLIQTKEGKELLKLLESKLYPSVTIDDIRRIFKQVSKYKFIDSSDENEKEFLEIFKDKESKDTKEQNMSETRLKFKQEKEEKAEKIMELWSSLENKIITEFYKNFKFDVVKNIQSSNGEDLQMFGDFLKMIGNFATFFYTHKKEATQAIKLIETFRGILTPSSTAQNIVETQKFDIKKQE